MEDQLSAVLEQVAQQNPAATQQTMQALQQAVEAGELDFPPHILPRIGELIQVAADNPQAWPQVRQAALQLGAQPTMLPAETATADEIQQFVSGITMLMYMLGKMSRESGGMPQGGAPGQELGMGMAPPAAEQPTQMFGNGGQVMGYADGGMVPGQTSMLTAANTRGAMTPTPGPAQVMPTRGFADASGNPFMYDMGDGSYQFAKGRNPADAGYQVGPQRDLLADFARLGFDMTAPGWAGAADNPYNAPGQQVFIPGRESKGIDPRAVGVLNGQKFTPYESSYDPLRGYANGGAVDSQPAMMTPGEYVLTPEATALIGIPTLDQLNYQASGRPPGGQVVPGELPGMPLGGGMRGR